MGKIGKYVAAVPGFCIGLGFLVAKLETVCGYKSEEMRVKKQGWVEGHKPYGFYEKHVKRPLDFGMSLAALIFLWPVMLAIGIAVRVRLGKPVLFLQERPGLSGEVFIIRKFRTMRNGGGRDEERLTDFGRKLRAASVDELPELINIIKGDMSIVGPRPLLVEYLPRYSERQKRRHDVRPGLTGLAQVSGRNALSWREKFEDDVKYVEKITFLGDMKILVDTIVAVLGRKGISSRTCETMEVFTGDEV